MQNLFGIHVMLSPYPLQSLPGGYIPRVEKEREWMTLILIFGSILNKDLIFGRQRKNKQNNENTNLKCE